LEVLAARENITLTHLPWIRSIFQNSFGDCAVFKPNEGKVSLLTNAFWPDAFSKFGKAIFYFLSAPFNTEVFGK
jgi:hypothetical protein